MKTQRLIFGLALMFLGAIAAAQDTPSGPRTSGSRRTPEPSTIYYAK